MIWAVAGFTGVTGVKGRAELAEDASSARADETIGRAGTKLSVGAPRLRLGRAKNSALALGLAVNHLMNKKAYDAVKFTSWSKILAGQVNRGHYCFVFNQDSLVVGMIGWAYASRDVAERWVRGQPVGPMDSKRGSCIIFNLWSADDREINALVFHAARQAMIGCETLYYRRLYADGRLRPVRLSVNQFVKKHVERKATGYSSDQ